VIAEDAGGLVDGGTVTGGAVGSGDGAVVDDEAGEDAVGAGGATAFVTVIGLLVAVFVKLLLSK
jgi:hypothetical protein